MTMKIEKFYYTQHNYIARGTQKNVKTSLENFENFFEDTPYESLKPEFYLRLLTKIEKKIGENYLLFATYRNNDDDSFDAPVFEVWFERANKEYSFSFAFTLAPQKTDFADYSHYVDTSWDRNW